MPEQLPLALSLNHELSFERYFKKTNPELCAALQQEMVSQFYLWGKTGVGKTHLLQAACQAALKKGQSAFYIGLSDISLQPEVLDDLEHFQLLCLDDADAIFGKSDWEHQLFHCYNRFKAQNGRFIIAAKTLPEKVQLQDLKSRLLAGATYHVQAPGQNQLPEVLSFLADQYGLELSEEVAAYLITRSRREISTLSGIMRQLDQASLKAKRRLTVPFVREVVYQFQV